MAFKVFFGGKDVPTSEVALASSSPSHSTPLTMIFGGTKSTMTTRLDRRLIKTKHPTCGCVLPRQRSPGRRKIDQNHQNAFARGPRPCRFFPTKSMIVVELASFGCLVGPVSSWVPSLLALDRAMVRPSQLRFPTKL